MYIFFLILWINIQIRTSNYIILAIYDFLNTNLNVQLNQLADKNPINILVHELYLYLLHVTFILL